MICTNYRQFYTTAPLSAPDCSHSGYCDHTCGDLGYIEGCGAYDSALAATGGSSSGSSSSSSSDEGLSGAAIGGITAGCVAAGLGAAGAAAWYAQTRGARPAA